MIRKPDPERPLSTATPGRRSTVLPLIVVLGLIGLPAASSWRSEFRVHNFIKNDQTFPALATDGSGRFLAVWVSERQDGELTGIFARLFNSSGTADRPEFQVNVNWEHLQEKPFVAARPGGGYLITWFNYGWYDIAMRLYDGRGYPMTGELTVNEPSPGFKGGQTAGVDGNGGIVVAWHGHDYEIGRSHIFARLFDPAGNPLGPSFRVSRDSPGDQMNPALAVHPDGRFTVVWSRFETYGGGADIVGRSFNRSGLPLQNEFFVNSPKIGRHDQARAAVDPNGAFMVCWHAHTYTEEAYNILARRFGPEALPVGGEFVVNTSRAGWQIHPSIAFGASGYLLSWQSYGRDGDGFGIFATVLDSRGLPRLSEFRVNGISMGRQERPSGVFLYPNRIAVAWQDDRGDPSGWDVYAAISDVAFDMRDAVHPAGKKRHPPLRNR